jgi:pyruvate/2-oxoglutarate dehydrogenase complex dihydrolipoamide dehydrogenase (E3) component
MKAVPRRLLVLGAGPAGVELAQVVRRFGGEAALVEAAERVLAREPAPLGEALGEVTAARSAAITSSWQQGVARATAVSGLRRSASTPAPTGSQLTRICASATAALSAVSKTATYTHALAESKGFLTLVSDGERVTGAYALGPEAGEWLQQATLAIRARVPLEVMNDTIQPFPSFSEIFATALKALRREISYGRQPVGQEPGGAATVSR